jgi:hypothetical protein
MVAAMQPFSARQSLLMGVRHGRSVLLMCGALALGLPASGAHAQADDAADTDSGETLSAPAKAAPDARPNPLRLKLAQVIAEREQASRLLPWLTFGVGYGSTLIAALSGAGYALACETHCATPNWVSFVVVAGGAIGTLGSLWVLHANANRVSTHACSASVCSPRHRS